MISLFLYLAEKIPCPLQASTADLFTLEGGGYRNRKIKVEQTAMGHDEKSQNQEDHTISPRRWPHAQVPHEGAGQLYWNHIN